MIKQTDKGNCYEREKMQEGVEEKEDDNWSDDDIERHEMNSCQWNTEFTYWQGPSCADPIDIGSVDVFDVLEGSLFPLWVLLLGCL